MDSKKKIVILAAGQGKRMKSESPKVLVKLKGKPMLEYLVESVIMSGVDKKPIIVVSPDNQEKIKKALAKYDCQYAIQEKQLGTGHALSRAKSLIDESIDHVICFYGDHPFIRAKTIERLAAGANGLLTIMTAKLENFEGWRQCFYHWGRIIRNEAGRIIASVEFKDATEEIRRITEVNPSMYCFQNQWLWENLKKIDNKNAQSEYYLTDVVKLAFKQGLKINSCEVDPKEAIGINSPEELKIAESMV